MAIVNMTNLPPSEKQAGYVARLEERLGQLAALPDLKDEFRQRLNKLLSNETEDISERITALLSMIGSVARQYLSTGDVLELGESDRPIAVIGIVGDKLDRVIMRTNGKIQREGELFPVTLDEISNSRKFSQEEIDHSEELQKMRLTALRWKAIKIAEERMKIHSKGHSLAGKMRIIAQKIAKDIVPHYQVDPSLVNLESVDNALVAYFLNH